MQFHIDIDHPGSISGWLLPDNPSAIPTLILSSSGCPTVTMTANAHRPDIKSLGQHTTGLVGFLITEAIVPGLSGLKDFEIREAESNLLVYRRCRGLKRKVFCFANATDPMVPLAARLKTHFTLYYDAVEQQPYDTIFALLNNQSPIAASLIASGRPCLSRYESILNTNGFTIIGLLRSPYEDLASLLMSARRAVLEGQPVPHSAPLGSLTADTSLDDARALEEGLRVQAEGRPEMANPLVRMFATQPDAPVEKRHVPIALNTLAGFDLVGTRSRMDEFEAGLAEILGIELAGGLLPESAPDLAALAGRLATMPTVRRLLALDQALYEYVEGAIAVAASRVLDGPA